MLIIRMLRIAFQKVPFCILKDGILAPKRCPFGMQKGTSWKTGDNSWFQARFCCDVAEVISGIINKGIKCSAIS